MPRSQPRNGVAQGQASMDGNRPTPVFYATREYTSWEAVDRFAARLVELRRAAR